MKLFIFAALFATAVAQRSSRAATRKSFTATTILAQPFAKRSDAARQSEYISGEKLEGFSIDLLEKVAAKIDVNFNIRLVKDGKYGFQHKDGHWDGMIGELVREEADIAVAPLTITSVREGAVDFSAPFMKTGIMAITTRMKLTVSRPDYFFFLNPFSYIVWLLILLAYVTFSVCLFLINMLDPREWLRAAGRDKAPPADAGLLSFTNSLFFGLSTLTWQGYEKMPRSLAGRVLAIFWFIFVISVLLLYTSGLLLLLDTSGLVSASGEEEGRVYSVDDIVKHDPRNFSVFVVDGGNTMTYMRTSDEIKYVRIRSMLTGVASNEDAIKQLREGTKGVMFMESVTGKFLLQRKPCDLTSIDLPADPIEDPVTGLAEDNRVLRDYGFATSKGSDLKDKVSLAILELHEQGEILKLQKKWWYDMGECGVDRPRQQPEKVSSGIQIEMENLAGPLLILAAGLFIAAVTLGVESLVVYLRHRSTD